MVNGYRYIQTDESGRIDVSCDYPVKGVTIDTEGMTVPEKPTDAVYDLYYNDAQGLHWVKATELPAEDAGPTEAQIAQAKLDYLLMMAGQ